ARVALAELGRLHEPVLCHSRLEDADWLNRDSPLDQTVVEQLLAGFVERYRARLDDAHLAVAHRLVASFDAWSDAQRDDAGFARHCQQVLALDALETLPPPSAPRPLAPEPADEAPHPPGDEPLWNESWYFDVADPEQGIGAYFRLGLDPAQGTSWSTTLICGPDRETVALVDFAAPLPGDDLVVRTEAFESAQACEA